MEFFSLFVDQAYAQDVAGAGADGGFGSIAPLILIFFIFYLLLIRPQQKKLKQHQSMVKALSRNDKVVTAGGIVGTISKVLDDSQYVDIKIAKDVEISVVKSTIAEVVPAEVKEKSANKKPQNNKKKKK